MTENERKMIYLDDAINGAISIQRSNGVEIYSDKAVPVEYLINLPSVQAEPELTELLVNCPKCGHTMSVIDKDTLIRCWDCKHSVEEDNGKYWCNHPQNICFFVKPTDFLQ